MLDNYSPEALAEDAKKLKGDHPRVLIEASGVGVARDQPSGTRTRPPSRWLVGGDSCLQPPSLAKLALRLARSWISLPSRPSCDPPAPQGITREMLPRFFSPYIDIVSLGSLTHGYAVADFSLKILKGAGIAAVQHVTTAGTAGPADGS
jgi:hypothetical protein